MTEFGASLISSESVFSLERQASDHNPNLCESSESKLLLHSPNLFFTADSENAMSECRLVIIQPYVYQNIWSNIQLKTTLTLCSAISTLKIGPELAQQFRWRPKRPSRFRQSSQDSFCCDRKCSCHMILRVVRNKNKPGKALLGRKIWQVSVIYVSNQISMGCIQLAVVIGNILNVMHYFAIWPLCQSFKISGGIVEKGFGGGNRRNCLP